MTRTRLALGAALLLALTGSAAAQTTEIQSRVEEKLSQERKKKMHEDMAVFRLLLNRAVNKVYGLSDPKAAAWMRFLNDPHHGAGPMPGGLTGGFFGVPPGPGMGSMTGGFGPHPGHDPQFRGWAAGAHHDFPLVDSVYLPKQGVVVTLSVPPINAPEQKSDATPAPASDWEQARKDLRGERTVADKKPAARPSLSDAVLRLLAENGKNFSQLPEQESITIALTFRDTQNCRLCHLPDTGAGAGPGEGGMGVAPMGGRTGGDPMGPGGTTGGGPLAPPMGGTPGGSSGGSPPMGMMGGAPSSSTFGRPYGTSTTLGSPGVQLGSGFTGSLLYGASTFTSPTYGSPLTTFPRTQPGGTGDAKNHLLLAELHMKQKRYKEAAAEYGKALEAEVTALEKPPEKRTREDLQRLMNAVEISSKLASALLADGKLEQAQTMMDGARKMSDAATQLAAKLRGQAPTSDAGTAGIRVPSQLVISAPKRLLDQVGQGKISFDEFRKQATVEYNNFPAEEKKDPMK